MKYSKEIIRSTLISISIALAIFCIVGIIYDVRYDGNFSMEKYQFTKMVLGCVIIGLGFGVPSFVYDVESLPRPVQVLLHMGLGCIVYTITAYFVGWLGSIRSIGSFLLLLGGQILLAFLIWIGFLFFYRGEARKMNERLQAKK